MSDIYYKNVLANTPKEAVWIFTENEKTFQEKYGLRTNDLMKIESVESHHTGPFYKNHLDEDVYIYKIGYSFRRASL